MSRVFVSYASQDREVVRRLVRKFEAQGWEVWWDRDIAPGTRYDRRIEAAVRGAAAVVVVWSRHSVESDWVRWEAHEGLARGVLIPVVVDGADPPAEFLRTQVVDLRAFLAERPDPDDALGTLLGAVSAALDAHDHTETDEAADHGSALSDEHGPGSDFASRPAIAVLPFREVSPLPGHEHFVDAACEDLVSALSSWRSFPVISYASTLPYKGQIIDPVRVGEALGAGYLVQGSVRRTRDGVRVQAELTRTDTRHQLWADRWEAPLDGFWDLQEELAEQIAVRIHPALQEVEWQKAQRKKPADMNAWDLAVRAHVTWGKHTPEDNARARELAQRALQLDPRSVFASIVYAKTFYIEVFYGWAEEPVPSIQAYAEAAARCVELAHEEAESHVHVGMAYMLQNKRPQAITSLEQAVALNPSLAFSRSMLGQLLILDGRAPEGIEQLEQGLRLAPNVTTWMAEGALALGHFALESYDEAVGWAEKCVKSRPQFALGYALAAASEYRNGDEQAARRHLADLQRAVPGVSRHQLFFMIGGCEEDVRARYTDALEGAGLELA